MTKIYKSKNARLYYCEMNNLVRAEWMGQLDTIEFKYAMEAFSKQADQLLNFNVIMNYRKMTDITAEARVWYKDYFLCNEGVELLHKVDKWATIKPSGMVPRIIVDRFKEFYLEIYPKLNYHQFVIGHIADKWIESNRASDNSNLKPIKSLMF